MGVGNIGRLGIVNTIVRLRMTHSKNIKCEIDGENGTEIIIKMGVAELINVNELNSLTLILRHSL